MEIEAVLDRAEASVARGDGLKGTGFQKLVSRARRDPELARRYGARIAAIDNAAFRRWAMLVVPIVPGTALALLVTGAGLALVAWSYRFAHDGSETAAVLSFLAGLVVLLATTHGLGHLIVGRLSGIRFTAWFVASLKRPQPGVKIDYDTYLRSTARRRAWTHAAGAIFTKIVPFALIGAARAAGLPDWVTWLLLVMGTAMLVTDILWSSKASDWARFRRELA